MSRFDERLAEHSVRSALVSLREAVAGLPAELVEQVNDAHPGTLDRTQACIDYVDGLLQGADGRLVAQASLDGIHGHVDQALQAVANLASNPSTYAANLDQAIESAIQAAAPLGPASAGFVEAAQKLGRRSGGFQRKLRRLEGEAEAMGAELRELEEKAGSGLEELTSEQQARREELTTALDNLKSEITAEQRRIQALATAFEERFTTEEAARKETFGELVDDLTERSNKTAEALAADAAASQKALVERGEASLAEVEDVRDKVKELYGLITDTATAGAFHDEARDEREAANHWRRVTIGFGTVAIVIAIVAVVLAAVAELSPTVVIAKVTATVACGAIAAYAGKQSGHHRARGDQAKDLELELVTAEGFLHGLGDDEQRELRKAYFERAFRGRQISPAAKASPDEAAAFGMTPELLSALMAMLKAAQSGERGT